MVEYHDINEISPEEFERMELECEREHATVLTLVLRPTGNMVVFSPMDRPWTRHFLLEAGVRMPGVQAN